MGQIISLLGKTLMTGIFIGFWPPCTWRIEEKNNRAKAEDIKINVSHL